MDWTQAVAPQVEAPQVDSSVRVWPTFDHDVGMTEARELIGRFRTAHPDAIHSVRFTTIGVDRVLRQPGCAGLRAYFAQHPSGVWTLVLAGVDIDGNDIDDGELAEMSWPCPPMCPQDSALNV